MVEQGTVDSLVAGSSPVTQTMKISMWIPKNKEPSWMRKFIQKEIVETQNVKSKETRDSALRSLNTTLLNARRGACVYAEDDSFELEHYDGKQFKYHCGREFIEPEKENDYT